MLRIRIRMDPHPESAFQMRMRINYVKISAEILITSTIPNIMWQKIKIV